MRGLVLSCGHGRGRLTGCCARARFFTNRLTEHTTKLAEDCEAVVLFVNDQANAKALRRVRVALLAVWS